MRNDQGQYVAHPFPTWSDLETNLDRTWNVQQHLPLSAIFILEQSETDEVFPIGQGEAAVLISELARDIRLRSWWCEDRGEEMAFKKSLFDNVCELAKSIPTFRLRATLPGRFWEEMERVL